MRIVVGTWFMQRSQGLQNILQDLFDFLYLRRTKLAPSLRGIRERTSCRVFTDRLIYLK